MATVAPARASKQSVSAHIFRLKQQRASAAAAAARELTLLAAERPLSCRSPGANAAPLIIIISGDGGGAVLSCPLECEPARLRLLEWRRRPLVKPPLLEAVRLCEWRRPIQMQCSRIA